VKSWFGSEQIRGGILLILLAGILGGGIARSEEPPNEPAAAVAEAPQVFPGPGEVATRLSQLTDEALQTETRVTQLSDFTVFQQQIETIRKQFSELTQTIKDLGEPEGWYASRLLDFKARIEQHRTDIERLLTPATDRLKALESLRKNWLDRKQYWSDWRSRLKEDKANLPADLFEKADKTIEGALAKINAASAPLLAGQQAILERQEKLLAMSVRIDNIIDDLKRQTFNKNDRSFFSPDYYRQFGPDLMQGVRHGVASIASIDSDFFQRHIVLMVLQLLIVLILPVLISTYHRRVEGAAEWQFMLHHPLATGIFVAVASLGVFYSAPPPIWRLGQTLLGAFATVILVSGIIRNPRRRRIAYLIAFAFALSLAFKIVALPSPLYRLFLLLLCLFGIPVFWVTARRNLAALNGRMTSFTIYLRIGVVILLVALIAQLNGYATLAALLVESSLETVIVSLFFIMALRLSKGAIEFVFDQPLLRERLFIKGFGRELVGRLQQLVKVFLAAFTFCYLLTVWGVYDTLGETFDALLSFDVKVGEFHLSVSMVLLVILVLYLSIILSWILRALLDAQVFPHSDFDRGVRDAIKKLLHYALVLVGFLLAMSLAGLELKNFAVLAGALGVGIGFGLQDVVNNFVSGLILLFERPVKVGDGILIDGEYGVVCKIGLRSTVVETLDQSEVIVPNSQIISQKVTNLTLSTRRVRVVIPVGVAYGSDVPLVMDILGEVARAHPDVMVDPAPNPIFTEFGDSSLNFELRLWIANVDLRPRVKSDLLIAIDRRFREAGVEIPFPQRDLHLRSVDERILERARSSEPE